MSFDDLTSTTCRFPIGDPRVDGFGFCGKPKPNNSDEPYCGECNSVARVKGSATRAGSAKAQGARPLDAPISGKSVRRAIRERGAPIPTEVETKLRAVGPIYSEDLMPGEPATDKPVMADMAPTELLIDEAYQRNLSKRSITLIRRIVESWDWRRFKPPIVALTANGYEIVDGQHTAIGAATHPAITSIPVMIIEAADMKDRAGAFVGHNRDRLNVTPMQMHVSAIAAGDDHALTVTRACKRAGVTLLRKNQGGGSAIWNVGDTIAITSVSTLVKKRGEDDAVRVMSVLVRSGAAPLTMPAMNAVDDLLHNPDHGATIHPDDLVKAIVETGPGAEREAKMFQATYSAPLWKGLVSVWLKKLRKMRAV